MRLLRVGFSALLLFVVCTAVVSFSGCGKSNTSEPLGTTFTGAAFTGTYSCRMSGFGKKAEPVSALIVFKADGQGNITAADVFFDDGGVVTTGANVTGSYTYTSKADPVITVQANLTAVSGLGAISVLDYVTSNTPVTGGVCATNGGTNGFTIGGTLALVSSVTPTTFFSGPTVKTEESKPIGKSVVCVLPALAAGQTSGVCTTATAGTGVSPGTGLINGIGTPDSLGAFAITEAAPTATPEECVIVQQTQPVMQCVPQSTGTLGTLMNPTIYQQGTIPTTMPALSDNGYLKGVSGGTALNVAADITGNATADSIFYYARNGATFTNNGTTPLSGGASGFSNTAGTFTLTVPGATNFPVTSLGVFFNGGNSFVLLDNTTTTANTAGLGVFSAQSTVTAAELTNPYNIFSPALFATDGVTVGEIQINTSVTPNTETLTLDTLAAAGGVDTPTATTTVPVTTTLNTTTGTGSVISQSGSSIVINQWFVAGSAPIFSVYGAAGPTAPNGIFLIPQSQ